MSNYPPTPPNRDVRRYISDATDPLDRGFANPMHEPLVFTDRLARLPAWVSLALLLILLAALGALGRRIGDGRATILVLAYVTFALADWLLLAALPRLGLSFGPPVPTLWALWALRLLIALIPLLIAPASALTIGISLLCQAVLFALSIYALAVEPSRVTVTHLALTNPHAAANARPLRIAHITDIHMERLTRRERQVVRLVNDWQPDLILMTGDFLNLSNVGDERAIADVREMLGCMRSACGTIYAVRGTSPVDPEWVMPPIVEGMALRVLEREVADIELGGHRLCLLGLPCLRNLPVDGQRLRDLMEHVSRGAFTILLYHMPDLMPLAARLGVDLYLAGHTHGGQVRLPIIGALATSSQYGRRYQMGLYREGGTTLYVSRGLGMEGMGAPRIRFLAPPEILFITLHPG